MEKIPVYLVLFVLVCGQVACNEKTAQKSKLELLTDSLYFTKEYFRKMQQFIRKTGEKSTVNISPMIGDSMMVDYYTIYEDTISLTVDFSERIYMNGQKGREAFGNILLENGRPRVEFSELGNEKLVRDTYLKAVKRL